MTSSLQEESSTSIPPDVAAIMELLRGLVRVLEKMGGLNAYYMSSMGKGGDLEKRLEALGGEVEQIKATMLSRGEFEDRVKAPTSELEKKISALAEEVEHIKATMASKEEFEGLFKALASAIERARR